VLKKNKVGSHQTGLLILLSQQARFFNPRKTFATRTQDSANPLPMTSGKSDLFFQHPPLISDGKKIVVASHLFSRGETVLSVIPVYNLYYPYVYSFPY
jgi:hypothetical protein